MMNTPNTENDDALADAEADVMRWRVYLRSVLGPYEQYDGHVDVWSYDGTPTELLRHAVDELRHTAFPDRGADCWTFVRSECLD